MLFLKGTRGLEWPAAQPLPPARSSLLPVHDEASAETENKHLESLKAVQRNTFMSTESHTWKSTQAFIPYVCFYILFIY